MKIIKVLAVSVFVFMVNICFVFANYEITTSSSVSNKTYSEMYARYNGGVFNITNTGQLTLSDIKFISNEAEVLGGAIFNTGKLIINEGVEFLYNTASSGGAIYNSNNSTTTIGANVKFISNTTFAGGVISNDTNSLISIGSNVKFINNSGQSIFNDGKIEIGNGVEFSSNTEITIYNIREITIDDNAKFNYNKKAIYNAASIEIGEGAEFSYNTSINTAILGGAIYNNANHYGSSFLATITIGSNARFTFNSAEGNGGAIYNDAGIINLISKTGNIIFANNTAKGISNAIHDNRGTINLWASQNANIIFNDRITSENNSSILNINSIIANVTESLGTGKILLDEDMSGYTGNVNLYNGNLEITEGNNFFGGNFTIYGGTFTANANSIIKAFTNNGTVNLTGGTLSQAITGNGTTEITGTVTNNATIANLVTVNGILTNNSTIGNAVTINFGKQLTTNANNVHGTITNSGKLILNGGRNSNSITGTGTTEITGTVTNNATIANLVTVNGTLTNNSTIGNAVTINSGKQLTTNANNINGTITNSGKLILNGGTNSNSITGNGTTEITGTVTNNATIANLVTVNGTLTNNSTISNNVTIKASKQLTTNATNINGQIENNGTLMFNEGTNNNSIYGNGRTIIDGEIVNSSTIATNVMINEEKQLTTNATNIEGEIENNGNFIFNGGENKNYVFGKGITTIDGEIVNSSTIATNVMINEEKQLTTNSNNVKGTIANRGKLILNGGSINKDITGNGTVEINGEVTNNAQIVTKDMYINGIFRLGEEGKFYDATNSIMSDGAEIDLQNKTIQNHNFSNLTINSGQINLLVDADLANKQMDTISADGFTGEGNINIKAINILSDNSKTTEILFTSLTVLKDKITSTTTASSSLCNYYVAYDNATGVFSFKNAGINPVVFEQSVASSVGGFVTQTTILNQAFSSMENIKSRILQVKNEITNESPLYASTANTIFFQKTNRIESGLWIRPFYSQETVKLDKLSIDNTQMGTFAGLDLAAGEESLVSIYLGYAGSEQKYEQIKINQMGYILGVTGMLLKEKWYAGVTANINFNKAESESVYGTDKFDMNMYGLGAKAGYNYEINEKWMLEPNLTVMYGNIDSQEYETVQGAKIEGQSTANIIFEPQIKARLNLQDGWQPYGLIGYIINAGDKVKTKVDKIEFDGQKIGNYIEFGAGVDKSFKNSPWSFYVQLTGRSGDRTGFDGNFGIKYSFLTAKEKRKIAKIKKIQEKRKAKQERLQQRMNTK